MSSFAFITIGSVLLCLVALIVGQYWRIADLENRISILGAENERLADEKSALRLKGGRNFK